MLIRVEAGRWSLSHLGSDSPGPRGSQLTWVGRLGTGREDVDEDGRRMKVDQEKVDEVEMID